ncbi:MAG: DUF4160 domain-containing protein [Ferrovibrio sp.]|nr:DUF4160 domain-containing protein [Ferrovibrio sp.]
MPTVLRQDGLRIVIYPNDHRPAHIHAMAASGEAVFVLHCPDGPPSLRENYGFNQPDLGRVLAILKAHLSALCGKWEEIHGHY